MQLVLTLNTYATRGGVVLSPPPPSLFSQFDYADERQLRVEVRKLKPITLRSDPNRPLEVVAALLNCRNPRSTIYDTKICAFTSRYGFPGTKKGHLEIEGYQYFPLAWVKGMIDWLANFADLCARRDADAIHAAIVAKWSDTSKTLFFEPSVSKDGALVPQLVVPSLFQFCVHELLTIYYDGASPRVCSHCGNMQYDTKRADAKYCSNRCKTAHHRLRKKSEATV